MDAKVWTLHLKLKLENCGRMKYKRIGSLDREFNEFNAHNFD